MERLPAVRVVSRRMVRPPSSGEATSSKPEAETVHLAPWDLQMLTIDYIQKGVLLPKPLTGGVDLDHLASSFARALRRFYPFAGRLAVEEEHEAGGRVNRPSITVSLRCNGEGAEFVHAVTPGVTVADVAASLYVPRVVWSFFPLDGLVGADAVAGSRAVLAAQVTELADGIFVAMSLSHGVADGTAFWHLFNTWSEISRSGGGRDEAESSLDEASLVESASLWHRDPRFAYMAGFWDPAMVVTGNSPRFDAYGNDFGWGAPVAVRSGRANKVDGTVTVYEGRGGGGGSMALEVCLAPEALARLVADDEFMDTVSTTA